MTELPRVDNLRVSPHGGEGTPVHQRILNHNARDVMLSL